MCSFLCSILSYTNLFCFFSSLGEQGNTASKSVVLRKSALSLACTEILDTVEVSVKSTYSVGRSLYKTKVYLFFYSLHSTTRSQGVHRRRLSEFF